jgi:anti-anti-sigma factor
VPSTEAVSFSVVRIMSAPPFEHLEARIDQGCLVLTITELHVEGDGIANALRTEMLAALAHFGSNKIVVDFQHTEYISSVAFRPLLSLRRKLQETGGRVVLCGASKSIGDVFYTTRLVDPSGAEATFEMVADCAAAVAKLNAPPAPA